MEFSRLGSTRLIPLRARLIFATHCDLAQLVAEGKFRQDLYYRINVMRIETPALQEHPEDIPSIAKHFLHKYSQSFQKPMEGFTPEALDMLQSYQWPGNVRELEGRVKRAVTMAEGSQITATDLDLPATNGAASATPTLKEARERGEKDAITRALTQAEGNVSRASKLLEISRPTLYELMKYHGVRE